ncbi:hypothetical protein MUK42_29124 [Musa troglodytarum]|uniref:Uncharacterized protein n=1 Tax=Musa troglodytarum TaxID=320322 RepID=A0A9E7FHQ5_9LILI|nr:hypothetical protein MUK42_29124 [Musa troglodytarum]
MPVVLPPVSVAGEGTEGSLLHTPAMHRDVGLLERRRRSLTPPCGALYVYTQCSTTLVLRM